MDTKLKGDIAEQAFILSALKRNFNVLLPVGDRLPYDLVLEVGEKFIRVQVKSAWFDSKKSNFVTDVRRTKTNRRNIKRDAYSENDFDFAAVYIEDLSIFYIFPSKIFVGYGSEIHLVESNKRQRKPLSSDFRDAWDLITQWAA
jgi:hypothetical protein